MSQSRTMTAMLAGVVLLGGATAWAAGGAQPLPQPTPGGRVDPRPPTPVTASVRVTPPTVLIDTAVTIDVTLAGGPPLVAGGSRLQPVYTLTATKLATTAPPGRSAPPAGGGERVVIAARARTEPLRWTPRAAGTYNLYLVVE